MRDIWIKIFCLLPIREFISLSSVNKFSFFCSRVEGVWKCLSERDFNYLPEVVDIPWRNLYIIQYLTNKSLEKRSKLFHIHVENPNAGCSIYPSDEINFDLSISIKQTYDKEILNGTTVSNGEKPALQLVSNIIYETIGGIIKSGDVVCLCIPDVSYWHTSTRLFFLSDNETLHYVGFNCYEEEAFALVRKKHNFSFRYWIGKIPCYSFQFDLSPFLDQLMRNQEIIIDNEDDGVPDVLSIEEFKMGRDPKLSYEDCYIRSSFVSDYFVYFVYVYLSAVGDTSNWDNSDDSEYDGEEINEKEREEKREKARERSSDYNYNTILHYLGDQKAYKRGIFYHNRSEDVDRNEDMVPVGNSDILAFFEHEDRAFLAYL